MLKHLRDVKARRKGEGIIDAGFTLIELLVVIVVLGILAATVVFALSGVSGQSKSAACNSDAKTIDVAIQAYINSPDNSTNSSPGTLQDLVSAPFNNPSGQPDTFMASKPTAGDGYTITLSTTTPPQVKVNGTVYDDASPNPCSGL